MAPRDDGADAPAGRSVVTFEPVPLGPIEVSGVPVAGVVLALAFVVSLGTATRLARRTGPLRRLVIEAHAVGALAALAGAWLPRVAERWRSCLDHPANLLAVLAEPASPLAAAGGAVVAALLFAWGSRRAAQFCDVLTPGASGILAAALALPLLEPAAAWTDAAPAGVAALGGAGSLAWVATGRVPGGALLLGAAGASASLAFARGVAASPIVAAAALGGAALLIVAAGLLARRTPAAG